MSRAGALRVEPIAASPVVRQALGRLTLTTSGPGFQEITAPLAAFVRDSRIVTGIATLLCRHTSASLTIQENADPDVQADLSAALDRLAPRDAGYVHAAEGPDDMPGHIRAMLTGATLSIPIVDGQLALGTWQGIYLIEHRDLPHRREVVIAVLGA